MAESICNQTKHRFALNISDQTFFLSSHRKHFVRLGFFPPFLAMAKPFFLTSREDVASVLEVPSSGRFFDYSQFSATETLSYIFVILKN